MLPAFTHLPLATGYVLVGLFACATKPAPDITLNFQNNPPTISHARSSAYLMKLKKDSSSPNYGGEFPILDGLTNGRIRFKYDLSFRETEEMVSHTACVSAKTAHIVITYKPTVYISSNLTKGSCRYSATLGHEMKHVNTDIAAIREFIPDIINAAADALRHAQTAEPIASRSVAAMRDDASEKLSTAIEEQTNALQKTRHTRQRKIDSRAEYERLSKACAGERRR